MQQKLCGSNEHQEQQVKPNNTVVDLKNVAKYLKQMSTQEEAFDDPLRKFWTNDVKLSTGISCFQSTLIKSEKSFDETFEELQKAFQLTFTNVCKSITSLCKLKDGMSIAKSSQPFTYDTMV